MEEWRQVPGFERIYIISSEGRIQSSYRPGRNRKQDTNNCGYKTVDLYKDKKCISKTVHRLVARAFLGERPDLEVNHKNGDKTDNRLENLEYVTGAQNREHARANRLYARGEKAGRVKLTADMVREIQASTDHYLAVAERYGIRKSQVHRIRAKETWCHLW